MKHYRIQACDETGMLYTAIAPYIISASRATDIPAFYSDSLIQSLQKGFMQWKNPFNGKVSFISFAKTRLFVFWSKYPQPLIDKLDYFHNYYFQYTLNDYEKEKWEIGLPPLQKRIDTFINLSRKIGKEKVIWRFDPLIITDSLNADELLSRLESIGNQIHSYTDRLVFSFVDVSSYRKVRNIVKELGITDLTETAMHYLAAEIALLNRKWKLKLGSCAERIDLSQYGIEHNRCIDDRLIKSLFSDDEPLMRFIGLQEEQIDFLETPQDKYLKLKDKGQRKECGCIISKDIGAYNSCRFNCVYCYAGSHPSVIVK